MSAPFCISIFTTSLCPLPLAACRGVEPPCVRGYLHVEIKCTCTTVREMSTIYSTYITLECHFGIWDLEWQNIEVGDKSPYGDLIVAMIYINHPCIPGVPD